MRNILIADTKLELIQPLAHDLANTQRFNIIKATNGSEVYQKAINQEFDLFILEFDLQKLKGKELVKSLKENPANIDTYIIFICENIDVAKVETAGIKNIEYIQKTYETNELITVIEDCILKTVQTKMEFNIDVEIINPFISATIEILKEKCQINNIKFSRPRIISKPKKYEIIASVAIVSKYYIGKVSACLEGPVFLKIASNFSGKSMSELNDESKDIALDILQEIFTLANTTVADKKFTLEEAIASLIDPKDFMIHNNSVEHNIGIDFTTDNGNIFYIINVQKNEK